jgi:predicted lipoprotein with Yx(FWY)xxD motif
LTTDQQSTARALTSRAVVLAMPLALGLAFALLHPVSSNAAQVRGPVVSMATTSLGGILANAQGRTLYLFAKDKSGKSACTGQCATFWPPLIASGKPVAGAGVKASLLGTTKRADGRLQVTYNRHPLYTFTKDTKKGQTSGEALNAFGANWFAVSPAGSKVAKATSSGSTSSGSTSGGYR